MISYLLAGPYYSGKLVGVLWLQLSVLHSNKTRKFDGELFYRLLYDSETRRGIVLPITVRLETDSSGSCFSGDSTTRKLVEDCSTHCKTESLFGINVYTVTSSRLYESGKLVNRFVIARSL